MLQPLPRINKKVNNSASTTPHLAFTTIILIGFIYTPYCLLLFLFNPQPIPVRIRPPNTHSAEIESVPATSYLHDVISNELVFLLVLAKPCGMVNPSFLLGRSLYIGKLLLETLLCVLSPSLPIPLTIHLLKASHLGVGFFICTHISVLFSLRELILIRNYTFLMWLIDQNVFPSPTRL